MDLHRLPTNIPNVNQMSTSQASTSRTAIPTRRVFSALDGQPESNGGGGNGNNDEDADRRRRNNESDQGWI